ncbi:MAG TPA: transaldolase [Gemmatimonadaceae bacterium]|nr:transaldolase [Gemmatimonadaceae bacterium]
MTGNRLQDLHDAGQSVWLDFIDRTLLHDGRLERMIRDDALAGMTSNPTIFEKALAEGTAYDGQIAAAAGERSALDLFELIETDDVRTACDHFRETYERTRRRDGYVSIEVSPAHANRADETIEEAHRLWRTVDRPNVMVKVPGTPAGAAAVRRLIADGINVNVTLLFSLDAHARVIEAYLAGLEDRLSTGAPIDTCASVASFFVSRVDTEVDRRLEALAAARGGDDAGEPVLALRGKAAVANARRAYALFRERFSGARWDALARRGAMVQRPLWASTSTKNPAYRDVIYVEQLIGPHTVNTLPPATIDAFRDHGVVERTIDRDLDAAERHLAALSQLGIDLGSVTDKLLADGVAAFQKSFDALIAGLERKAAALVPSR